MRFWFREIMGWLLVLLGLYVFFICVSLLLEPTPRIIEGSGLSIIGFIIFRGGIHLLKVAVAARVCMQTQDEIVRQKKEASKKPSKSPVDW